MHFSTLAGAAAMAVGVAAQSTPRYAMYFDEWHTAALPDKSTTAGVNYVITAFAATTLFNSDPPQAYTPFMSVADVRAMFDEGTKVCMAIGGWGDTSGFSTGAKTDESRKLFAKNVASTIDSLGYDCIDVDWEYPGGNGEDYRQIPNSDKVDEIDTYPLLLAEIKAAIGDKELSIAVPGKEGDMIAFTAEKVPSINDAVDFVNVMTYDLMNRRDNTTHHHTSISGSLNTIDIYINRGMSPAKMNLGIAFYAKWFTTANGVQCTTPTGCPTALLEAADGSDTGLSGAQTFETALGITGETDTDLGGQWYWDSGTSKYWTWDTPDLISQKFDQIVAAKGLGGVFAWSLGEDGYNWAHLEAMQKGVANWNAKKRDAKPREFIA